MKIFLSADIEGITGMGYIINVVQTHANNFTYHKAVYPASS